jgi:hypothetical protein
MALIASKLRAKHLVAAANVDDGDVKSITINSGKQTPDGDGNINLGNVVNSIKMNGGAESLSNGVADLGVVVQSVAMNGGEAEITSGTAELGDVVSSINMNDDAVQINNGAVDLGDVVQAVKMNGSTVNINDGTADIGNVAKTYTINGTKTNIGTGGDVSIGNVVQTFNGNAGAITAVSSVNGATGAITGLAKVDAGGTKSLTWAQVAAGGCVGLFGDVCNRDATLNITGAASATTNYTFNFYTHFNGTFIITFADATTQAQTLSFEHISGNFIIVQSARAQRLIVNQNCRGAFQFHSPYMATPTATGTSILTVGGNNTAFFHVATYQTPASTNYSDLFVATWGASIITSYSAMGSLTGAARCANITFGSKISLGETPAVLAYSQTFGDYVKAAGRFLYPTSF